MLFRSIAMPGLPPVAMPSVVELAAAWTLTVVPVSYTHLEDKRTVLKPATVSCPFEKAYPAFQDLKITPLANRIPVSYTHL